MTNRQKRWYLDHPEQIAPASQRAADAATDAASAMGALGDATKALESDLAMSGAAQREACPDAVDMTPLAQTSRRATRRRLNPFMAALVGGLLIGMKGDEK